MVTISSPEWWDLNWAVQLALVFTFGNDYFSKILQLLTRISPSYSFGAGFFLASLAESFVESVFPNSNWSSYGIHTLTASVGLWSCIVIGFIGAHCFTKVNVPLFIIQFSCIIWGLLSIVASPDPCSAGPQNTPAPGFLCGELLCSNATATFECGRYHG